MPMDKDWRRPDVLHVKIDTLHVDVHVHIHEADSSAIIQGLTEKLKNQTDKLEESVAAHQPVPPVPPISK